MSTYYGKKTFKEFISEAAVSAKRVDKAVEIFVRLLSRKLGTRFYRFGGSDGVTQIKNGIGFLYFYNMNKAIRFNYVNGDIESITLWNKYLLGKPGNKTISFKGIGLLKAGKKLLAILSGEETDQNGEQYFILDESTSLSSVSSNYTFELSDENLMHLNEAKRISIEDAINLVSNYYDSTEMTSMTRMQIQSTLEREGYAFPTKLYAFGEKIPGRREKTYNLIDISRQNPDKSKVGTVKISSGDKQTSKEIVPGLNSKAKEMETQAREIMTEPTEEQIEELRKKVDSKFYVMENLVRVIARDASKSLIIYGSAGVGKTFVVNKTLKEEGFSKGQGYYVVKGRISTSELYRTLFMHRQEGKILVFDDSDSCAGDTSITTDVFSDINIEDLYDSIEKYGFVGVRDETGEMTVLKPSEEVNVLSYDEERQESVLKPMNYIMKHKVKKEMFRLTNNETGKHVDVTKDHSCIVERDGKMIEVKPEEIIQGSDKLVYV